MTTSLTFLGTGSSMGIPEIGCPCEVCQSSDIRDKRTRTGVWMRSPKHSLVIDTSVDFRQQALQANIDDLHTICLSHLHSDHFLGLDDVRAFRHPINVYVNPQDWDDFHYRYSYAIKKSYSEVIRPQIIPHKAISETSIACDDLVVEPFPVMHGNYEIRGFLIHLPNKKRFAFITDCKTLPSATIERLKGVDYLALSCLWQHRTHSSHLNLDEAKQIITTLQAKNTWLFHLSHKIGLHKEVEAHLPSHIYLAYDNLKINL